MAQYTLKLSFDIRQVTQSLTYEFVKTQKESYPKVDGGPLAGTFNFQQGDEIIVEVMATSAIKPDAHGNTPEDVLKDFMVTNCTFVSIPAKMTEHLSLFDKTSACASVDEWEPVKLQNGPQDLLRLCKRSVQPLAVVTKHGQWQISGYLSVMLTPLQGPSFAQLYFFDPETSTGGGGGWNK